MSRLDHTRRQIIHCRQCPRLVQWREEIAARKIKRFVNEKYWGRPVPGFGDPEAEILILGLAPAAHGANRTGRMFTGDRSGEWLYRALYKSGFANQAKATALNDGLVLHNCYVSAVLRCAPPKNTPLKEELEGCRHFLIQEIASLKRLRVMLALGRIAFDNLISTLRELGIVIPKKPVFQHGASVPIHERLTVMASYHPSQQNTFTGILTEQMFDSVFQDISRLISPK